MSEAFQCRKCNHTEAARQLRHVLVNVGWKSSQVYTIAPCLMCTKCGNTTVVVEADIGELAGLVPENEALPKPPPGKGKKKAPKKKAAKKKSKVAKAAKKGTRQR